MQYEQTFFDKHYKLALLVVFIIVWLWSSWHPTNQTDWLLENNAILVAVPVIYFIFIWYIRFSKISFTLVTIFALLHVVGAHYAYGSVPFGFFIGRIFHSEENMYDKLVHFSFGLLIVYPFRELFLRVARMKGFWAYIVPFMAITTVGTFYEIYEWFTVLSYSPQIGYLFIGGNDPFDTTKDLFSAVLGSLLGLTIIGTFEWIKSKDDFLKNMRESFSRDRRTFPIEDIHLHERFEKVN